MNTLFTAALLAGGKSSRMGQDKATLDFEGQVLWKRQIGLLERLQPAQLLISGRPDGPYVGSGYTIVYDRPGDLGPLGGLLGLLERCETPRLLVLAVDMPWMTGPVLEQLLSYPSGVVAEHDGWLEGTAAVYPVKLLSLVRQTLSGTDRSFQVLLRSALSTGEMETWTLPKDHVKPFQSWNHPASREKKTP